jgi:hypothetical protein
LDSSEDDIEAVTLAQLNEEKIRDARELKDNAHEDEDAVDSVSSVKTEGNSSSSSDEEQEEEEEGDCRNQGCFKKYLQMRFFHPS